MRLSANWIRRRRDRRLHWQDESARGIRGTGECLGSYLSRIWSPKLPYIRHIITDVKIGGINTMALGRPGAPPWHYGPDPSIRKALFMIISIIFLTHVYLRMMPGQPRPYWLILSWQHGGAPARQADPSRQDVHRKRV